MPVRRTLAFTLAPALLLALAACGIKGTSDFNLGVEAAKAGNQASAVAHYTDAIAANPELTAAWYNRGYAEMNLAREAALANRDADAVKILHACMADWKKSKELMDRGVFLGVKEGEQADVKAQTEKAVSRFDALEKVKLEDAAIAKVLREAPEPGK